MKLRRSLCILFGLCFMAALAVSCSKTKEGKDEKGKTEQKAKEKTAKGLDEGQQAQTGDPDEKTVNEEAPAVKTSTKVTTAEELLPLASKVLDSVAKSSADLVSAGIPVNELKSKLKEAAPKYLAQMAEMAKLREGLSDDQKKAFDDKWMKQGAGVALKYHNSKEFSQGLLAAQSDKELAQLISALMSIQGAVKMDYLKQVVDTYFPDQKAALGLE